MEKQAPSEKTLAVALVAVSKSMAAASPVFRQNLSASLKNAEVAGVSSVDLQLLRLLVKSALATEAEQKDRSV